MSEDGFDQNLRWEEWLNRKSPEMEALCRQVEEAAKSYTYRSAVEQLRRTRLERQNPPTKGKNFWKDTKNRALLLLALMARPGTIEAAAKEIDLPEEKPYKYFGRWCIDYRCLPLSEKIRDEDTSGNYREYEGIISYRTEGYFFDTNFRSYLMKYRFYGCRQLKEESKDSTKRYRRDSEWKFQYAPVQDVLLSHVLSIEDIGLTLCELSTPLFAGLRDEMLARLEQESRALTSDRYGVVPHPQREGDFLIPIQAVAKVYGKEAVQHATVALNLCRCTFWNDATLGCGLKLRPATHCEDYHPLDEKPDVRSSP